MKKYYIYSIYTDEKVGEIEAHDVNEAERKALKQFPDDETYALTTDENEPLA